MQQLDDFDLHITFGPDEQCKQEQHLQHINVFFNDYRGVAVIGENVAQVPSGYQNSNGPVEVLNYWSLVPCQLHAAG
jgi:hypothetical protein